MSAYRDKPPGWIPPNPSAPLTLKHLMKRKCKATSDGYVVTLTEREWEDILRDPAAQRMLCTDVPKEYVARIAGSVLIRITADT